MDDRSVMITECPRDAFQGLAGILPTAEKVAYYNLLVRAGIRRIDFGSFVSPLAVPQMADTVTVLTEMEKARDLVLIGIVGNTRGMASLLKCSRTFAGQLTLIAGYPLSVSERFQERNLNRTIEESWIEFDNMRRLAEEQKTEVFCYLSMAFGNPYGEVYTPYHVYHHVERLWERGATFISLADTVGSAKPALVREIFEKCHKEFPELRFGAHFHSQPGEFADKVQAALDAGCRIFDSALGGVGGCPFAADTLTSNIDTLELATFLEARGFRPSIASATAATLDAPARALAARYATA